VRAVDDFTACQKFSFDGAGLDVAHGQLAGYDTGVGREKYRRAAHLIEQRGDDAAMCDVGRAVESVGNAVEAVDLVAATKKAQVEAGLARRRTTKAAGIDRK
jgi:hypothetical protein